MNQLPAVVNKEEEKDTDSSNNMGMSSSHRNSTSGAGTLVGDNMALGDDPFNGRINMFNKKVKPGRQTVDLDALQDRSDFRILDDEVSESNRGSLVGGQCGASSSIKTPGFNAQK